MNVFRNVGLAGVDVGKIAGRHGGEIVEIKGQRVLRFFFEKKTYKSKDKEYWTDLDGK